MDRAFEEKYSTYMEKVFCLISHKNKFMLYMTLFSTLQISELKKRLADILTRVQGNNIDGRINWYNIFKKDSNI